MALEAAETSILTDRIGWLVLALPVNPRSLGTLAAERGPGQGPTREMGSETFRVLLRGEYSNETIRELRSYAQALNTGSFVTVKMVSQR